MLQFRSAEHPYGSSIEWSQPLTVADRGHPVRLSAQREHIFRPG
jgi:hypothetical protein